MTTWSKVLITVVVVLVVIGGYMAFGKKQTQSQVQNNEAAATKTLTNSRVGYTLAVPTDWVVLADQSYADKTVDKIASTFIKGSRGSEVSRYSLASTQALLDCNNSGPDFDNCLKDAKSTGAIVDLTVTYRPEATLDEVVAADTKFFNSTWPFTAAQSIAGLKTFQWDKGTCSTCTVDKSFVFNGKKDHLTYELHELITVDPAANQTDTQKQSTTATFQPLLDSIVKSLTISS